MVEEKIEKKEVKPQILVVAQLPTQAVRIAEQDGVQYELIPIEEAMTEILQTVRHIKKSLG